MAYTQLHDAACEDEKLAALADEDPLLYVLWIQLLAGGQPWGRYPDNPRLIIRRCCALFDVLTPERVEKLTDRLAELGMLTRYVCEWTGVDVVAITHYSKWNSAGRKYHRMGKPEFSPHPGWTPPDDLVRYITAVCEDKFKGKTRQVEQDKFGVFPGQLPDKSGISPGQLPDKSGQNPDIDIDVDGENNERLRLSGTAGGLAVLSHETASGNGHQRLTRRQAEKLWAEVNGAEPRRASDRDCYQAARRDWLNGGTLSMHKYQHPPPVTVIDDG